MNDKILQLVEEKGPELVNTLNIAASQVYEKLLWYVRLDGILGTLQLIISSTILIPWYKISKRMYEDGDETAWIGSTIILFFVGIIWMMVVEWLIKNIVQIISPEYYIIGQILNKI